MSNTSSTSVDRHHTTPDTECQARAQAYLATLVGVAQATSVMS